MNYLKKYSCFKTLYFNLHYFGLRGLTLPVLIGRKFKLKKMQGKVIIPDSLNRRIYLGTNDYQRFENYGYWINSGTIEFLGTCSIANGTYISVKKDAHFTLGNNVYIGGNNTFSCDNSISIGDDTGIAWNVTIMDDDSHRILDESGALMNPPLPISIGKHVWVGFDTRIMKGSVIPNHSIVACGSTITKEFSEDHVIIGGFNKVLKKSIYWEV